MNSVIAQVQWLPDARQLIAYGVALAFVGLVAFVMTAWLTKLQARLRGQSAVLDRFVPWLPLIQIGIWAAATICVVFILSSADDATIVWVLVPILVAAVFASRDIVRNAFAGVLIALEHSILTGDTIHVSTAEGEFHGEITSIGLRRTTLKTADRNEIHLPNHTLLNSIVKTNKGHELDSAIEIVLELPTGALEGNQAERWKRWARRAASFSRFASPRRKPAVFVQAGSESIRLVIQAYAFAPGYTRHLESDIVEMFQQTRTVSTHRLIHDASDSSSNRSISDLV